MQRKYSLAVNALKMRQHAAKQVESLASLELAVPTPPPCLVSSYHLPLYTLNRALLATDQRLSSGLLRVDGAGAGPGDSSGATTNGSRMRTSRPALGAVQSRAAALLLPHLAEGEGVPFVFLCVERL